LTYFNEWLPLWQQTKIANKKKHYMLVLENVQQCVSNPRTLN